MKKIGLLLLATSCLTQESFEEDFSESFCTLLNDCEVLDFYGYRNLRDCQESASVTESSCNFSDDQAEACLDDIEQTGCADLWEQTLPDSCAKVCG